MLSMIFFCYHCYQIEMIMAEQKPTIEIECKKTILLRNITCEVLEAITKKKVEIMTNNPHRSVVSDSEAVSKLILGK